MTSNSFDLPLDQPPLEENRTDSKGRLWNLRQKEIVMDISNGYIYATLDDDSWICSKCGGEEPTLFTFIYDEVVAQDPTERLNDHDCDIERVRKIIES